MSPILKLGLNCNCLKAHLESKRVSKHSKKALTEFYNSVYGDGKIYALYVNIALDLPHPNNSSKERLEYFLHGEILDPLDVKTLQWFQYTHIGYKYLQDVFRINFINLYGGLLQNESLDEAEKRIIKIPHEDST